MSSAVTTSALSGKTLRQLHRGVISSRLQVLEILDQVRRNRIQLQSGVDRKSNPRTARILSLEDSILRLKAGNILAAGQPQIYLSFDLDSTKYFFAAPPIAGGGEKDLLLHLPEAIYEAERRDLTRELAMPKGAEPRVSARSMSGRKLEARLVDWSYQGMGLLLPDDKAENLGDTFELEILEGQFGGEKRFARVRRRSPSDSRNGWTRLGVEVSRVKHAKPFPVERRDRILDGSKARRVWRKVLLAGAIAKRAPGSALGNIGAAPKIELVSYRNDEGREISGLVDRAGTGEGGTAVVIPPAWGRTKETFLPLARTLVSTFQKQGEPLVVLRFDGTNRRGESYVDPSCRSPGEEYGRFRFSQAVGDIRSSFEYLRESFRPKKIVLVSFSLGSVEGRRAIALEQGAEDLAGWVSVVGMVDLQSGLRTVSGGVDFAHGYTKGISFGRHELVGVIADMDFTGRDAYEHHLGFLEDAKRDMALVSTPITWIHGRYDAWMDLDRVRALMSAGESRGRKLIEVAAGHQMRNSTEALETFQLVSVEAAKMALGFSAEPAVPDLIEMEARTQAERDRRPQPAIDRESFWADYLLGRDRRLGFELLSATSAYRELMNLQIDRMRIQAGNRLLDLGSGTGEFAVLLAERGVPRGTSLVQIDLVTEALGYARERMKKFHDPGFRISRVSADLEIGSGRFLPLAFGEFDAILASLMISYVEDHYALLGSIAKLLRPGGRLVLSTMKRDADVSRLYVNSIAELPPDRRALHFGSDSIDQLEELQRVFLNDAAKLLRMEEEGVFRFFDPDELVALVESVGLSPVHVDRSFGSPPQAAVVTAIRPLI